MKAIVQVTAQAPPPPSAASQVFTETFFKWRSRDHSYSGERLS